MKQHVRPASIRWMMALVLFGATQAAPAQPTYSITPVPLGPGWQQPSGLNKKGWTANQRYDGTLITGYRCTKKLCTLIPALPNTQGRTDVSAYAIDDAGNVFGQSPSGHTFHAFRFDGASTVDLGAFPEDGCGGCFMSSAALGTNNAGQVVGYSATGDGNYRGVIWQDGQMQNRRRLGGAGRALHQRLEGRGPAVRVVARTHAGRAHQPICLQEKPAPRFAEAARFFARCRDLTASGFCTTPQGMQDLGIVGNTPSDHFDGPPLDVIRIVGVS